MKSPTIIFNFFCSGLFDALLSVSSPLREGERDGFDTHFPCTRLVNSAAIRGSISTAVHNLHFSRILTVKFPVPGPISRTESVERRPALSTILRAGEVREG